MKLIKLSVISAAVLGTTAAMAAQPTTNTVAVAPAPHYQYDSNAGIIRNTTGAVVDTTRTLFDTATHPAAVSAEAGTLGYGANVAWGLNETTELQAGWAGGNAASLIGGDFDAHDVNYDLDTDFSNPYLGVNLRPAGNWFTVSTGIIVPNNDLTVTANPKGGVYKIDGKEYDADQVGTLKGTIEHRNKLAPYATIGFRPNINNNWGVFGELGGAYLGKSDAEIRAVDSNTPVTSKDGSVTTTAGGVAALAQNEIEDENYARWLPIAKVGVTYRF